MKELWGGGLPELRRIMALEGVTDPLRYEREEEVVYVIGEPDLYPGTSRAPLGMNREPFGCHLDNAVFV